MERNRKNCAEDVAFEIIFDKGAKCCRVEIWRRLIQVEVRKGVSVYWGEIKSRKVSLGRFKGGTLNVSLNLFNFVGIRKLWKAFQLESNTIVVYLPKPFGRWNNLVERSDGEMEITSLIPVFLLWMCCPWSEFCLTFVYHLFTFIYIILLNMICNMCVERS